MRRYMMLPLCFISILRDTPLRYAIRHAMFHAIYYDAAAFHFRCCLMLLPSCRYMAITVDAIAIKMITLREG